MGDRLFTLVINYLGEKKIADNIDPDRYNIIDLCDDIKEKFPGISNIEDRITCSLNGYDIMNVKSDSDVMEMFVVNHRHNEIELFVGDVNLDGGNEGDDENDFDDGRDQDECMDNNIGADNYFSTNVEQVMVHESIGDDLEKIDDESSSDSDFIANIDDDDNRTELELTDIEASEDELEGYQSDNHCEPINNSDDELQNDPLCGAMDLKEINLPDKPRETIVFEKDQCYPNVYIFREVLRDFVLQEGFEIHRIKNEKTRVRAVCATKNCPWMIYAGLMKDNVSFIVKKYNGKHTCVKKINPKEASAKWMVRKLIDLLRENPDVNFKGMEFELKRYGVSPTYMQAYRAKMIAINEIEGNHSELYQKLPYYTVMAGATNSGSVVILQCQFEDDNVDRNGTRVPQAPAFKRFFMGLAALRDGFLSGCAPFIGFDGCHLKGHFGGVLLSAIGLDGNNGLYPIAFAIVESECKESWMFFFEQLMRLLGDFDEGKPWTFMTDRQKGLVEVIDELFPGVINRKCARHIYANFKDKFAGPILKKYFWMAARSYTYAEFDKRLKNDHVTNNFAESFNNWIRELRPKPILTLIDELRSRLMCRLQKRKKNGEKWSGRLVQNVVLKLNLVAQESGQCHILIAGNDEYQIKEKNVHYIVNLERRMCNCGVWELSGIPCKHAAVAIYHKRQLLEEYVDDVYSSENYLKAYCHIIHPIPHHEFWPENLQVSSTNLAPLLYKRKPGRPKKSRNREAGEGGASKRSNSVKCKRCGGWGRNIRTCKGIQAISSTSNPSVQASSNNLVEVNVESSCTQKISATINNVVPRPKPSVAPRSKPRSASLEPPNPSTLTPANPKTTPINVVPNGKRVSTTTSISKFKPPAKVRATSKSYASSNSSARSVGDNEKISVREDDPQQ